MSNSATGQLRPEQLHQQAVEQYQSGDRRAALESLRTAIRESVDLEFFNDLGVIGAETLGANVGRAVFDTVLAIEPGHSEAAANRQAIDATHSEKATWRSSLTLGGPDPLMPERAFPGMPGAGVMREHALRYAFSLDLVAGRHTLDLGCGTGYGSEMLSWTAASVRGFDLWEPDQLQRPVWPGGAVLTYGHDLCVDPLPRADVAVWFEVMEHLADAPAALRIAWGAVNRLVVSFPNPVYHGSHHNPFHVNDWPLEQVEREIADAAGVRFSQVHLTHFKQEYRDGTIGMVLPGRDPEASYWIIVADGG